MIPELRALPEHGADVLSELSPFDPWRQAKHFHMTAGRVQDTCQDLDGC